MIGPAPLRLATICLDDAGVRARLDEWHHALVQALDRVEGRFEWSVKAFSHTGAVEADVSETGSSSSTGKGAAIDYEFVDMVVEVPRDTGPQAPRATWKLNGTLQITTSDDSTTPMAG